MTFSSIVLVIQPGLNIIGIVEVKSIMVDSNPKVDFPPSIIISTLPIKSSITCSAFVGLGFPETFALGAATYPPKRDIISFAILFAGSLIATVSSPPVVL